MIYSEGWISIVQFVFFFVSKHFLDKTLQRKPFQIVSLPVLRPSLWWRTDGDLQESCWKVCYHIGSHICFHLGFAGLGWCFCYLVMTSSCWGQYLSLQFAELVDRMPPTMPYNFERFIPTNKTSWTCTAAIYMAVIEKTCFFFIYSFSKCTIRKQKTVEFWEVCRWFCAHLSEVRIGDDKAQAWSMTAVPVFWGLHVLFCRQRLPPTFAFPQYPWRKYRPDDGTVRILTEYPWSHLYSSMLRFWSSSPFKKGGLPSFLQNFAKPFVRLKFCRPWKNISQIVGVQTWCKWNNSWSIWVASRIRPSNWEGSFSPQRERERENAQKKTASLYMFILYICFCIHIFCVYEHIYIYM